MSRYAVETHNNKEYFTVHMDVKVPKISSFGDADSGGMCLKSRLESINGIQTVTSFGQRLQFTRGGCFTVEELIPTVLEVLKRELRIHDDLVEVPAFPPHVSPIALELSND